MIDKIGESNLTHPALEVIQRQVKAALAEDLGTGDLTASLINKTETSTATLVCRENAVLAGKSWFEQVFLALDSNTVFQWDYRDGDDLAAGKTVCTLGGLTVALLSAERTALNFLQTLSGTATLARRYANLVAGRSVQIRDTRKTIPGLRLAQKYAARCGGITNHRVGLFDGILIKENHIAAAGSIGKAVTRLRELFPKKPIEVEVESLDEVHEAIRFGADMILLDNFDLPAIKEAVQIIEKRALVEVSGGIVDEELEELAKTGADYISVGAITKNIKAIDFSIRFAS